MLFYLIRAKWHCCLRDQAMESLNRSSGVSVSGFNFALPPPPLTLKKRLPPFSKTVKFSSSFNIQLEKCSAPPLYPPWKMPPPPLPPDNAEIGCASSIAWSLNKTDLEELNSQFNSSRLQRTSWTTTLRSTKLSCLTRRVWHFFIELFYNLEEKL